MERGTLRKWGLVAVVFVLSLFVPIQVCADWAEEVQEITKLNRPHHDPDLNMEAMKEEFTKLLYPFGSLIDEPVPHQESLGFGLPKPIISKQEAFEDVEHLFALLKYGYVGYQYFGGDESFQAAKQRIMAELQTDFSAEFPSVAFEKLIYDHLHFINDGHFAIGNRLYLQPQTMYMSFDYEFFRDSHGYYLKTNELREYLENVNGESVDPYLWPSLNDSGEIVYRIGILVSEQSGLAGGEWVEIGLRSNASSRQHAVLLKKEVRTRQIPDGSYTLYELEGISVIDLQQFHFVGPALGQFLDDAIELKSEELFIIDLRSNPGGLSANIDHWLHGFIGDWVEAPARVSVELRTNTTRELARHSKQGEPRWMIDALFPVVETGWSRVRSSSGSAPISNPARIVVLMDSLTASAGENFIRHLRQMESVVFIGTNTSGTVLAGDPIMGKLPMSYIGTYWGTNLKLDVESGKLMGREGIGFLPDFWVQSEDALDIALKFIHRQQAF